MVNKQCKRGAKSDNNENSKPLNLPSLTAYAPAKPAIAQAPDVLNMIPTQEGANPTSHNLEVISNYAATQTEDNLNHKPS